MDFCRTFKIQTLAPTLEFGVFQASVWILSLPHSSAVTLGNLLLSETYLWWKEDPSGGREDCRGGGRECTVYSGALQAWQSIVIYVACAWILLAMGNSLSFPSCYITHGSPRSDSYTQPHLTDPYNNLPFQQPRIHRSHQSTGLGIGEWCCKRKALITWPRWDKRSLLEVSCISHICWLGCLPLPLAVILLQLASQGIRPRLQQPLNIWEPQHHPWAKGKPEDSMRKLIVVTYQLLW
jgi:hypothetical protein